MKITLTVLAAIVAYFLLGAHGLSGVAKAIGVGVVAAAAFSAAIALQKRSSRSR